jgi:hypothetical protein
MPLLVSLACGGIPTGTRGRREPVVALADQATTFLPDLKHQDRFLKAQTEAREANLPDIAHDDVCMLLSTHDVNFSWWAGDHDAWEDRVL